MILELYGKLCSYCYFMTLVLLDENNVFIFQAGEFLMFGCLMLVDMALFAFLAYR